MNFFTKAILGSVGVLLAAAAIVLLFRSREAGRVEALIREAAGWAAAGETEKLLDLVDEKFDGGADNAKSEIRRRIRPGTFQKLEITDLSVGVSGDDAQARVDVLLQTRDMPMPQPLTYHVALRKREAGWRVTSVEHTGLRRLR